MDIRHAVKRNNFTIAFDQSERFELIEKSVNKVLVPVRQSIARQFLARTQNGSFTILLNIFLQSKLAPDVHTKKSARQKTGKQTL